MHDNESFYYDGRFGNTTYSEHTTVCESTKTEFGIIRDKVTGFITNINILLIMLRYDNIKAYIQLLLLILY